MGIATDLIQTCLRQLLSILPSSPNPDRGLSNLARYVRASRSPQALLALFERDSAALPTLMRILATSQNWSEQLIHDPESFDLLRMTEGMPVSRGILVDELNTENAGHAELQLVARNLHTFCQRETMRIAFGDFIGALPIETVSQQLSTLAEAIIETALMAARREAQSRFGVPPASHGGPGANSRVGVSRTGRTGAELFAAAGTDVYPRASHRFARWPRHACARLFLNALQASFATGHGRLVAGAALRCRRRFASRGSAASARLADRWCGALFREPGANLAAAGICQSRHVAGDPALAQQFLSQLEPWVYRRYLSRSDLTEIAAISDNCASALSAPNGELDQLRLRPGGVQDIEFLIQYLQLLNGGELPEVRLSNTLEAMGALERAGCLTVQERSVLDDNYRFLRRVEHRLQIVQGHHATVLPTTEPIAGSS